MRNLIGKEKKSILSNVLHGINIVMLTILLIFLVTRNEASLSNQVEMKQALQIHFKNDSAQIGNIMVSLKDIQEWQTKSNK